MPARTILAKTTAPGPYGLVPAALGHAPADNVDGNRFAVSGNDLLMAYNETAGALTLTVTSVLNRYGRLRSVVQSIPATSWHIFGPFRREGWEQPDGYIYCNATGAVVRLSVVTLPPS